MSDVRDGFLTKYTSSFLAVETLTIFAQIAEKLNKLKLAVLLYLILLSTGLNERKRGFYWYRLILLYKKTEKSFYNHNELIKIAENDRYIKAEYQIKIRKHSSKPAVNKSMLLLQQKEIGKSMSINEITIKVIVTYQ